MNLLLLGLFFPVCLLAPGLLVTRRLTLPDHLRLPVAVAASVALVYVAGFGVYLLGAGTPAYVAVALGAGATTIWARRDLLALLRSGSSLAILHHWALFAAWLVLLSFFVSTFSGSDWSNDWLEHYQRAKVFLGAVPLESRFSYVWSLAARPPLQNVVAAFFMRLFGEDFPTFQLTHVLLASLELLGAASLWHVLSRDGARSRAGLLVLTLLLCLNPSVVQNATYTWTRALTNFFVLQGAALWIAAQLEPAAGLRRLAYLHLGLALVTHYSAGPYLVALALVETWLLVGRRVTPRELVLSGLLGVAPVAPWLTFAIARFGVPETFLSNSTVRDAATLAPGEHLAMILGNFRSSLIPHPLRSVPPLYDQAYRPALLRDWVFLIYQVCLPAMVGSVAWFGAAWAAGSASVRRLRDRSPAVPTVAAAFVTAVFVLGVGTVSQPAPFGVAHACLQPLALAGVVLVAARWAVLPAWLRIGIGLGAAVDAALGIGLHFWVESLRLPDLVAMSPDRPIVSESFVYNANVKGFARLSFLSDCPESAAAIAVAVEVVVALLALSVWRAVGRPSRAQVQPLAQMGGDPGT